MWLATRDHIAFTLSPSGNPASAPLRRGHGTPAPFGPSEAGGGRALTHRRGEIREVVLIGTVQTSLRPAANSAAPGSLVALMQGVAARDRAAFAALYDATSAKLYGIVLRIPRRRDAAHEGLQEVYVQGWQRAASYDAAKGSPVAWLAAIARNRALDAVRRKAPLSLEDAPEALDIAAEEADPLECLDQSEDLARLRQCLDR